MVTRTSMRNGYSDTESGELNTEPRQVIGVKFIADLNRWYQDPKRGVTNLGSILLEKQDERMAGDDVRRALLLQLPEMPARFQFLSNDGSPIKKPQECYVTLPCLIAENRSLHLVRQYEKHKVGVQSDRNRKYGYIFVDSNTMLRQVRDIMWEQLFIDQQDNDDVPNGTFAFNFVDSNGFPIVSKQEIVFTILDIVHDYTITIQTVMVNRTRAHDQLDGDRMDQLSRTKEFPTQKVALRSEDKEFHKNNRSSKPMLSNEHPQSETTKWDILISYARKETEEHALQLKEELSKKSLNVFLDVHEINIADDWADSLNNAIKNCKIFVPLVSPLYGTTKWTNREVKMADKLEKKILPVSFVDNWPPDCLAIQLATIQYTHAYKGNSEHHDDEGYSEESKKNVASCSSSAQKKWDVRHVTRVAGDIYRIFKAECDKERKNQRTKSVKRISTIKPTARSSWMVQTPVEEFTSFPISVAQEKREYAVTSSNRSRIDIVISAHPHEKQTADRVMRHLKAHGYTVWSTTEMDNDLHESGLCSPSGDNQGIANLAYSPSTRNLNWKPESPSERRKQQQINHHNQAGRLGSNGSDLAVHRIAQIEHFSKKAAKTTLVVFIISKDFLKSSVSMQQVYYCQKRKNTIVIKTEMCKDLPCWWDSLMGTESIDITSPDFNAQLEDRVRIELTKKEPSSDNEFEEKNICEKWENELKDLPSQEGCVYIAGSTKEIDERTTEICDEIGKQLALVPSITLITGGFNGVQQLVARSFLENRKTPTQACPVIHFLPSRDSGDYSQDAPQRSDGSFREAENGRTVFIGDSIKEREVIIGRTYSICILIGGDARAAHEAEQFLWNDHFVIPIISTGGAAGGNHNLDAKILQSPHCVDEGKWNVLKDVNVKPAQLAVTVFEIWDRLHTQMLALGRRPVRLLRRPLPVKKRRRPKPNELEFERGSTVNLPGMMALDEEESSSIGSTVEAKTGGLNRLKWLKAFTKFNRFSTHL